MPCCSSTGGKVAEGLDLEGHEVELACINTFPAFDNNLPKSFGDGGEGLNTISRLQF